MLTREQMRKLVLLTKVDAADFIHQVGHGSPRNGSFEFEYQRLLEKILDKAHLVDFAGEAGISIDEAARQMAAHADLHA